MRQQHPHDVTDLRLAPVALLVDERLEELSALDDAQLAEAILFGSNRQPHTEAERGEALAAAATHLIDLAGWKAAWDPRGVRLAHHNHSLVLGVSRRLADFVTGASASSTVG
jgi:hypothetical protein